jgi:catechol 2,3-dioxygenase-like lactoylglutathione lyase family enzyme
MGITYQSSVMFVQDIAASRRFYEDLLGQEVDMDFGPNVGFKGGFALWQVDHAFQMIYEHAPERIERTGPPATTSTASGRAATRRASTSSVSPRPASFRRT